MGTTEKPHNKVKLKSHYYSDFRQMIRHAHPLELNNKLQNQKKSKTMMSTWSTLVHPAVVKLFKFDSIFARIP